MHGTQYLINQPGALHKCPCCTEKVHMNVMYALKKRHACVCKLTTLSECHAYVHWLSVRNLCALHKCQVNMCTAVKYISGQSTRLEHKNILFLAIETVLTMIQKKSTCNVMDEKSEHITSAILLTTLSTSSVHSKVSTTLLQCKLYTCTSLCSFIANYFDTCVVLNLFCIQNHTSISWVIVLPMDTKRLDLHYHSPWSKPLCWSLSWNNAPSFSDLFLANERQP